MTTKKTTNKKPVTKPTAKKRCTTNKGCTYNAYCDAHLQNLLSINTAQNDIEDIKGDISNNKEWRLRVENSLSTIKDSIHTSLSDSTEQITSAIDTIKTRLYWLWGGVMVAGIGLGYLVAVHIK